MRDFKNKWKRIAIDSNIACRRRFRNHFNFDDVKLIGDKGFFLV